MKRYAIFDFDGTLVDSMPLWNDLGKRFLQTKGIEAPENLQAIIQTMTLQQSARYMIEQFHLQSTIEQVMNDIKQLIERQYIEEVPLKPYVAAFLHYLHEHKVKMGIVTASEHSHVKAALQRLQIDAYFDFILTCTEVGLDKNQPNIYWLAAERWGTHPDEVMVFEDALNALQSAKQGGFYTIGVYDRSVEKEKEMCRKISDRYIMDFSEWGDSL